MAALKNVVIIGGSGNVGSEILAALLAKKDEFGIISALKRKGFPTSDILQELSARGIRVIEANYKNKDSLVTAFKGTSLLDLGS
jgi:uncharacterized protein YbjT (DUF2867 family)